MALTIYPITDHFVAEVDDVDLSAPMSADVLSEIRMAFDRYAVLIFPDQQLTIDQRATPPIENLFLALGAFDFDPQTVAAVVVTNEGADGHVVVDAVQWTLVKQTPK